MAVSRSFTTVAALVAAGLAGCGRAPPCPPARSRSAVALPPAPATRPAERPVELTAAERALVEAVNSLRAEHGRQPLAVRADLTSLARRHNRDMMRRGRLNHLGAGGTTLAQRASAAGIDYRLIGENIQRNRGYDDPPAQAVASWAASGEHRKTMLRAEYEELGVAAAAVRSGTARAEVHYFTAVFCVRKTDEAEASTPAWPPPPPGR